MHFNSVKTFHATALLGVLLSTASPAMAGLLGQQYFSFSYDHTFVETGAYDDGSGFSLFYNHPLSDTVDLGLDVRSTSWDAARDDVGDFSDQRVQVVATGYNIGERDNIFARVGAGLGKVERGSREVTSLAWSAVVGTEYEFSDSAVLQPYAGWNDVTNDGRGVGFIYGVLAAYRATDVVSITARVEGDAHFDVTLSLGGFVRF